jgi:hypothetical protein
MKSLHTLNNFDLDKNSVKDIMGLGKLTNLRELSIRMLNVGAPKIEALASSVGKLCSLTYLCIVIPRFFTDESNQLGLLSSSPFKNMETLELNWWFPRVPKWMGDLHCLRVLYLYAMETSAEDVHVLAKLPSLVFLLFSIKKIAAEGVVLGKGAFPVLEEFTLYPSNGDIMAFLVFAEGAMPKLRILNLHVTEWGGSTPVGVEHLILLEKICLDMRTEMDTSGHVVSVFRKALQLHPNRPSIWA